MQTVCGVTQGQLLCVTPSYRCRPTISPSVKRERGLHWPSVQRRVWRGKQCPQSKRVSSFSSWKGLADVPECCCSLQRARQGEPCCCTSLRTRSRTLERKGPLQSTRMLLCDRSIGGPSLKVGGFLSRGPELKWAPSSLNSCRVLYTASCCLPSGNKSPVSRTFTYQSY